MQLEPLETWQFSTNSNSLWHMIIASKHGSHPFNWLAKGLNALIEIFGKTLRKSFLILFLGPLCGWEGRETYFQEDLWVGVSWVIPRVVSFVFFEKSFCDKFTGVDWELLYVFLGFCCSLSDRERADIEAFISLLERHFSVLGEEI